jgi:hypothetical protein
VAPVAWAVTLACAVAVIGLLPTTRDFVPSRPTAAISVSVSPSDTLWSIASAHRIPGMSTAETVQAIVAANRLSGVRVVAGTVISVPCEGIPDTALAQASVPSTVH